ncbi:glycosyltransferase [Lacrimispora sp. NSJ-141]|uniref:Glycosyltransferase n=1 Tax=Lientehia hominis TaxID=2897778 RepID=A0AAP2W9A2_9FIRM|nr:glycosyltransferase [Lientehia hominis]
MKLLSIAVPCYNSQDYMEHCVNSLLPGGDDVEILIVNDGSKDDTADIANRLEAEHPGIVRAIHQENAGHGGAVNTGLAHATGLFFKVVDSDDWVDLEAYKKILSFLKTAVMEDRLPDLLLSNYVYEKQGAARKKIMQYRKYFPADTYFTWDDVKPLPPTIYILMHSVIFRTAVLRRSGLELPKKTFYVDNLFVFQPMPYVKTLYYIDADFYRYFIGREDQSVNESVMISRLDQQFRVTRLMIDCLEKSGPLFKNRTLCKNMCSYLNIILSISSIMAIKSGTEEHLREKEALWQELKDMNPSLYRKFRYRTLLGIAMNLPGKIGRKCSVLAYNVTQKIYGFN